MQQGLLMILKVLDVYSWEITGSGTGAIFDEHTVSAFTWNACHSQTFKTTKGSQRGQKCKRKPIAISFTHYCVA